MKKIVVLLLTVAMLIGMTISASAAYGCSYTAPKGTPTIDGEVDDLWAKAEWTSVDKAHDGEASSTSTLQIKLLWDEDKLYFLAEVFDETYNEAEDVVEIYLDQKNDRTAAYGADDSQTRFRLSGTVNPVGTNSQTDAEFKVKDLGDSNYILEGALLWVEDVEEGKEIGLEFMYNDALENGVFIEAYRWNVNTSIGEEPPYRDASGFGKLVLGSEDGSVPEVSEPEASEPEASEPEASEPEASEPSAPESSAPESSAPESSAPESSVVESSSSDNGGSNGGNAIIYIVIAAVVVAAVVVVVLLSKKGKK